MIGSYIKTSARNLMRNKLFSAINIVGLAISMSVGLLLIAFLLDLRSYDRFHKNGERIYRITNVLTANDEQSRATIGRTGAPERRPGSKFATTSIKTGKLIRQKVIGVDRYAGAEVTILRNDFRRTRKLAPLLSRSRASGPNRLYLKFLPFQCWRAIQKRH